MGACLYCGKEAGFWSWKHKSCYNEFIQHIDAINDMLTVDTTQFAAGLSAVIGSKIVEYLANALNIKFQPDEAPVIVFSRSQYFETKNVLSFERTGISYRRYPKYSLHTVDGGSGSLCITTKNLYFKAEAQTIKITLSKLLTVEDSPVGQHKHSIKIQRDVSGAKYQYFVVDTVHSEIQNSAYCLIRCLCGFQQKRENYAKHPISGLELTDRSQELLLEKMDNKAFAFKCIELLQAHGALDEATLEILTDKELCARLFSCSGFPILSEVSTYDDVEAADCYQSGRQRFYKSKIIVGKRAFVLSNHWYGPNKSMPDNRTPFQTWVLTKIQ